MYVFLITKIHITVLSDASGLHKGVCANAGKYDMGVLSYTTAFYVVSLRCLLLHTNLRECKDYDEWYPAMRICMIRNWHGVLSFVRYPF